MDLEYIVGMMAGVIGGYGRMANKMDMEYIFSQNCQTSNMDSGIKEKE